MLMRKVIAVISVLSSLMFIASCSATSKSNDAGFVSTNEISKTEVNFTGPYSQEFSDLYSTTKIKLVSEVIKDGELSEQDLHDIENSYIMCMKNYDLSVYFEGNMQESVTPVIGSKTDKASKEKQPDLIGDAQVDCYKKTGLLDVQKLYQMIHINPNHEDEATLIAACFVKNALASEGYSAYDYNYDFGKTDGKQHGLGEKSFNDIMQNEDGSEFSDKIAKCQNDPLGLNSN